MTIIGASMRVLAGGGMAAPCDSAIRGAGRVAVGGAPWGPVSSCSRLARGQGWRSLAEGDYAAAGGGGAWRARRGARSCCCCW
eukprot:scaffold3740_cov322-Prasinococcus_capsulatus_cf.AAC.12